MPVTMTRTSQSTTTETHVHRSTATETPVSRSTTTRTRVHRSTTTETPVRRSTTTRTPVRRSTTMEAPVRPSLDQDGNAFPGMVWTLYFPRWFWNVFPKACCDIACFSSLSLWFNFRCYIVRYIIGHLLADIPQPAQWIIIHTIPFYRNGRFVRESIFLNNVLTLKDRCRSSSTC